MILSRLQPDLLVTVQGRQLFSWLARTPANEDGGIEIAPLLHKIEDQEREMLPVQNSMQKFADQEGIPDNFREEASITGQGHPPRLAEFLRSVLEDSIALAANEELNAGAVEDCIKRLQQYRDEGMRRELSGMLQQADTLSDEQRRVFLEQYYQKLRERKGSPPNSDSD